VRKCAPRKSKEIANKLSKMLLRVLCLNNFQPNKVVNISMRVPVFGFVRAHPPFLDGGAAAGLKSLVLCLKLSLSVFCHTAKAICGS
jgi:hypothetical protein